MINRWKSVAIVFLVGICVTALEIASARLLAPYFGSTIYVWGGSIGTVLFALAVGYWFGGYIIDKYPRPIVVSWVVLIGAISTLVIPWMYQVTTLALANWTTGQHIPVSVGVMLSMGVLFVIPIIALGMISPMVLRLSMSSVQQLGSWSGTLSGAATLGSILGTFIAAYGTIPLLGTRWTILAAAAVLFAVSTLAAWPPKKILPVMIVAVLLTSGLIIKTSFIPRQGLAAEQESAYQLVQVIRQGPTVNLIHDAGRGTQSMYTPGQEYTSTAYDVFGLLPYMVRSSDVQRKVLIIGMGGGSMARLYERHLGTQFAFNITAVEIDPAVVSMAKKYFDLDQLSLNIVVDDARHYLRSTHDQYDIIIVDAYTHETQIPPMLATQEFFTQVQTHLKSGGVMGINALAFQESRFLPKFLSTIAAVFPDVREATFTPGALNHFIVAGERLDPNLVPERLDSVLQPYRDSALTRLTPVARTGDIYTDDRTDLDIRVKPFFE